MEVLLLHDDPMSRSVQVFINGLRRHGIHMYSSCDPSIDRNKFVPDLVLYLDQAERWQGMFQEYQQRIPCALLFDLGTEVEEFPYAEGHPHVILGTDMDIQYAVWMMKASCEWQKKNFALKKQVSELEGKLEARKLIDQAKGRLMDQLGYKEEEAFKYIRRTAMNQRKTLKEVSLAIINSTMTKPLKVSSS